MTLLFLIYFFASAFTHFSLNISYANFYPIMRRNDLIIDLREGAFFFLFLALLYFEINRSIRQHRFTGALLVTFSLFVFGLFSILAYNSVYTRNQEIIFFRVLISIAITFLVSSQAHRYSDFSFMLTQAIKAVILLELFIAIFQLFQIDNYFGRTFLGPRIFGSVARPLHLSILAGTAAVFLTSQRTRFIFFWLSACAFLALASGGRAGMLLVAIAIGDIFFRRVKKNIVNLYLMLILGVIFITAAYIVSSNSLVSGRSGTVANLAKEARWETWGIALSQLFDGPDSISKILFGVGVGSGSNSFVAVSEYGGRAVISDSTIIFLVLSFGGIAGISLMLSYAFIALNEGRIYPTAVLAWFFLGLSQITFEVHPSGLLLAAAVLTTKGKNFYDKKPSKLGRRRGRPI